MTGWAELLTMGEVACTLKRSRTTVRRWSDSGRLSFRRTPRGTRLYDRDEVNRLRAELDGAERPCVCQEGPVPDGDSVADQEWTRCRVCSGWQYRPKRTRQGVNPRVSRRVTSANS